MEFYFSNLKQQLSDKKSVAFRDLGYPFALIRPFGQPRLRYGLPHLVHQSLIVRQIVPTCFIIFYHSVNEPIDILQGSKFNKFF